MPATPLLNNRPVINPYLQAGGQIWSRLRWDFDPRSWSSRRTLNRLRDTQPGESAVIVCNGPSLLKTSLELLEGVYCFGLNKINLLFDKSAFRPDCIVAINQFVLEQNSSFFNETDIPLFLDRVAVEWIADRNNVTWLHTDTKSLGKFARDCSISISTGGTVTFVAMQLAYHMGFERVAVIGCDHNFATKGPAHATVQSDAVDESHFDKNYFAGGVAWQLPDLPLSEYAYSIARDVYIGSGRQLFNATVGGKLEILPRCSLSEFLSA